MWNSPLCHIPVAFNLQTKMSQTRYQGQTTGSLLKKKYHFKEPDSSKFPELDSIIDLDWSPNDPQGDIMEWINRMYYCSRGVELATFGPGLLSSAFREKSNKWESFAKLYISKIILVIHRFIMTALGRLCVDPEVLDELKSTLSSDLFDRYQAGMDQAMFLVAIERNMKPYTLNQAFSNGLQRSRMLRISKILEGTKVLEGGRRNQDGYVDKTFVSM